jgi:hypothetical protein
MTHRHPVETNATLRQVTFDGQYGDDRIPTDLDELATPRDAKFC